MYTVTPRTISLKCHGAPLALVSDVVPLLTGTTGLPSSPPPPGTSTRPHDGHVWLAPMSGGFQNLLQSLHHGNGRALHAHQARPPRWLTGAAGNNPKRAPDPGLAGGRFQLPLRSCLLVRDRDGGAEAHFDGQSPFRPGPGGDCRVVGNGDGFHDGQTETMALAPAGARPIETLEWLKQTLDVAAFYLVAAVGHRQDREVALSPGAHPGPTAGHVVAQGVVDQVGDEPLDQSRVSRRRRRLDMKLEADTEPGGLGAR